MPLVVMWRLLAQLQLYQRLVARSWRSYSCFPWRKLTRREKIRRLRVLLRELSALPILSRDDLERVNCSVYFDADERLRLSAAILATHIQCMVYEDMQVTEDSAQQVQATQFALPQQRRCCPRSRKRFAR